MHQDTIQEYLIKYRIPKLGIVDKIIVESRTTGKAEELLQGFLDAKHRCEISFVIIDIQELTSKEAC